MKQVQGWWVPDHDTTIQNVLGLPTFKGRPTYYGYALTNILPRIKDFRTAVDVGAHVGMYSWVLARLFQRVYAFEPVIEHFDCLARNLTDVDNVILTHAAVGERSAKVRMVQRNGVSVKAHVAAVEHDALDVALMRLDDFDMGQVDFLKIDVEGYELNVVAGAEALIKRDRPLILIEQKTQSDRYGISRLAALELLKKWGARIRGEWGDDYIVDWYKPESTLHD